jgi:integrase
MSKRNDRITVTLEAARRRFRWVTPDGKRPGQPIPNFDSLTANQVENLRIAWELTLNNGNVDPFTGLVIQATMTMELLWVHYRENQMSNLSADSQDCYDTMWRLYIADRWGKTLIGEVKTLAVEQWLRNLKTKGVYRNDKWMRADLRMSKETKQKIRGVMSAMFAHAIRAELCWRNPISCGGSDIGKGGARGGGAGVRLLGEFNKPRPIVHFRPDQVKETLKELGDREKGTRNLCLVLLDAVLGLRRGELGAIHWEDCHFDNLIFSIERSFSWKQGMEKDTKTRASKSRMPMHPVLRDALLKWREETPYNQPGDYVFASVRGHGKKPIDLKEVFVKRVKPVIEYLGFTVPGDKYGWHSFRHTVGTTIWGLTKDIMTIRDYLRHSDPSMAQKYIDEVDSKMIDAQDRIVEGLGLVPAPKPPSRKVLQMPKRKKKLAAAAGD